MVLCGPGNNGGDGYVAARHLAARGVDVRVAALAEPKSEAAKWARSEWTGAVETLTQDTQGAPLLIDALFGTGLKRGLEDAVSLLSELAHEAVVAVACDLPSGVESDCGALNPLPPFDLTVTFGALKPAHLLHPAMHKCGRIVLADIGIEASGEWHEIGPPTLPPLDPGGHKYCARVGPCARRENARSDRACGERGGAFGRGLCPGEHVAADRRIAVGGGPGRNRRGQ